MIADLQQLRPTEAVRLINSTPLGTVVNDWAVREDLSALGHRIAPDGHRINLVRYAAWSAHDRHFAMAARRTAAPSGDDSYERKRDREGVRARDSARSTRDIGELPPVANKRRKGRCRRNLRLFCETYFPKLFEFAWSADHLELIEVTQNLLLHGGVHAKAMWRGAGKTTILEVALLWAALYGHRRFILLLSNASAKAVESHDNIKSQLENNELLKGDFPEVCYPIDCLEGIAQRGNAQLYHGERTQIQMSEGEMVFPKIPGFPSSSVTIQVAGLEGNFRGGGFTRPDGVKVRPDAVLIDDPQTDESARSPIQCTLRERLIKGAVQGLRGHGSSFAAVMTCTVIARNDLSDRFLDRKKHPAWRGRRAKLVLNWPKDAKLWEEYSTLWREAQEAGDTEHKKATSFYRKHRKAMDEGFNVAWTDAYKRGVEISGQQHAWNLRLEFEEQFEAEFQNEPLPDTPQSSSSIVAELVLKRLNGLATRVAPLASTKVTAFIDVQGRLLYWLVAAWDDAFSGSIIDYGTWPKQPVRVFSLANAPVGLDNAYPGTSGEEQIRRGLDDLIGALMGYAFQREDATPTRISRCLIDANWGERTDLVCEVIRRSPHSSALSPSFGRGIGPNKTPISEWATKKGDRVGLNWRMPIDHRGRFVRPVLFDTNFWKTFVAARFAAPIGEPGSLTLWGRESELHRPLADHLVAEEKEDIEAKSSGRVVTAWSLRRPGIDNHWFDGIVGAAVGASMEGCSLPGMPKGPRAVRVKYLTASEFEARRGRAA